MQLLFYAPQMAPYGGIERHVCTLAAAAAARGDTVRFLTTSNSLGPGLRRDLNHPLISLRELPRPRGSAGAATKIAWLLSEVVRCRRRPWDLIYTNGQSALSRLVWRAAGSRTRIVHHHHNAADKREQATWSPSFLKTLQRAPELIGCSESTCAALNAATARSDARFLPYVTGCPIDEADVSDRAPGLPLRFGYCGRLIPEKGIDTILALADDPHLTGIEWHIHGAGEAYPPERFAGRPHLIYHGAYQSGEEQVSALLKLDALVLFSTHNEGMPLSLIEGMAAGLPWIGTDRGGTRELAAAEGNSVIIAPDARLQDFTAGVRLLADRILAGSTSRVRQRAAYNLGFAPAVAAARWLTFFGATPSASC